MAGLDDLIIPLNRKGDIYIDLSVSWSGVKKNMKAVGKKIAKGAKLSSHAGEEKCRVDLSLKKEIMEHEGKKKFDEAKAACNIINNIFATCEKNIDATGKSCDRKLQHSIANIACKDVKMEIAGNDGVSVCEWQRAKHAKIVVG